MSAEESHSNLPARKWVWRCSDESIATGQISIFAVVETLAVVAGYWVLVCYANWPWPVLISLLAAPMLLLRSGKSVELGERWLRSYHNRDEESLTQLEVALSIVGSIVITSLVCYWVAHQWLIGCTGWTLFWHALAMGSSAFVCATIIAIAMITATAVVFTFDFGGAVAVAVKGMITGTSIAALERISSVKEAIKVAGVIAIAIAIMLAVGTATLGINVVVIIGVIVGVVAGIVMLVGACAIAGSTIVIAFFPTFAVGLILRTLLIRFYATLLHSIAGLAQLPNNWRTTLWVIDPYYLPALLPRAEKVGSIYSLRRLWTDYPTANLIHKISTIIFTPFFYLPAVAYRWSLKASAWLWWPLVLGLMPPLYKQDPEDTRELLTKLWANFWFFIALTATLLGWLLVSLPSLSGLYLPLLPRELLPMLKELPILPLTSLRIVFGALVLLLTVALMYYLNNFKTLYAKDMESTKGFQELYAIEAYRVRFERKARFVDNLRGWLIAFIIFWDYAIILSLWHKHYQTNLARFDWLAWLWPIL